MSHILPGAVVLTSSDILREPSVLRRFICISPASPDALWRIPAGLLLPVSKFLARQPVPSFWALIHKGQMLSGKPCFIKHPKSLKLGAVPHRFESEGECRYYMDIYKLSGRAFMLARVEEGNTQL